MQLIPFEQLPKLEIEPQSDWAYCYQSNNGIGLITLVYASQRDFLSVPKTYQVIELVGEESSPLESILLSRLDYLSEMKGLDEFEERGIYELLVVRSSDDSSAEFDLKTLVLLDQNVALEIVYVEKKHHKEIYYCVDAQMALVEHGKRGD